MKAIFTLLLSTTLSITFSQKFDTVRVDQGKPGGILRIRELTTKGQIKKVWSTFWTAGGYRKSYSEYNATNERITSLDSMFNSRDVLIGIERKIGNTTEGDKQEFDTSGQLISRNISLHINNNFLVFQQFMNKGNWNYRTIVDGNPPDYIPINKERFEEAITIYNDRLLINKITK